MCQAGSEQGDARSKRLGQCSSARTLRAQTSSAASHSHAAEYGGGKTKSRQAGHDSAASYAASAQASATSNTSSTQSEPARQSFIVRPRVRAGIAVADVQDSTGAGGARIDPRRRFARTALPIPSAHTAPRPRVSRIQPSRYLQRIVQALGRGTPRSKQGPSHPAACPVRQGEIAFQPTPGTHGRQVFDSSAYQPPARPEERPPRSHHRHHAFAVRCARVRSGSAHACMRLTDCRRETAAETAPDAVSRTQRFAPAARRPCRHGENPHARATVADACGVASRALPKQQSCRRSIIRHSSADTSRLPRRAARRITCATFQSARSDGRSRRTTRPPDAARLV